MVAGAAHVKGGMALAAALALWVGIVAADKMGHGTKICEGLKNGDSFYGSCVLV